MGLLLIGTFLLSIKVLSQSTNLGTSPVRNFKKSDYQAGTQNWDITQDRAGRMYFANNEGLLTFDGTHWQNYPISNRTVVRSVAITADGKIFTGGQGEVGYWQPNEAGILHFQSLNHLLPEGKDNFEDVWDIIVRPEGLYFRSNRQIFLYAKGKMAILLEGNSYSYMGVFNGVIYVQEGASRFLALENGIFKERNIPGLPDDILTGFLETKKGRKLAVMLHNGLYEFDGTIFKPLQSPHSDFIRRHSIYCATTLANGGIALGTTQNGLFALDSDLRITQHLNKDHGLQNNTVLSLFADQSGNIWLGLDSGIDYAMIDSPISIVFPDGKQEGTAYTAGIFKGKIYFGTNAGLYVNNWLSYYPPEAKYRFKLVNGSLGQVWNLNILEGDLLMGHHEGAFSVNDESATKLLSGTSAWTYLSMRPGIAVAGTYNGLIQFVKNGTWKFDRKFAGFTESSRLLDKKNSEEVWVAHPYRGIYNINLKGEGNNVSVKFYGSSKGLPSNLNNYIYNIGGKTVVTGETGIYHYNEVKDSFEQDEVFNQVFKDKKRIKYLNQDSKGNIWYVADEETGMLVVKENALQKEVTRIPIPELKAKMVGGFEFILPVDEFNAFIATEKGFIHLNPNKYRAIDSSIHISLHQVSLLQQGDSILYGGFSLPGLNSKTPTLTYQQNGLRFIFSSSDFENSELVTYTYYLEGLESEWKNTTSKTEITYNNLEPGEYTFRIIAINKSGVESEQAWFSFEILAPWYATRLAWAIYLLTGLGVVGSIVWFQRRRFEKEKEQLQMTHREKEEHHERLARKSEEEISKLRNEKLESEINFKTKELATATMHLVQKNDIMSTLHKTIEKLIKKNKEDEALQAELKRMLKLVESDVSLDKDWEQFSSHFDQVHMDFLHKLNEQFPKLSPNDFKLCAYLRMNLNTKEIASLMNISVRGVEASRYRLRKKLNLSTETNLTDFLLRL